MNVICVQCDTAYQGMVWIYEFVAKQNDSRLKEIHWFCYDLCGEALRMELKLNDSTHRHHFYECFPHAIYNRESSKETHNAKLLQLMRRGIDDPSRKLAVIVDSFSTLTNESDSKVIDGVLREIYSNRRSTSDSAMQLFLTLRENSLLKATTLVQHLKYLANIWSTITDTAVTMKVKKTNGKTIKEIYEYNLADDGGGGGNFTLVKKTNVGRTELEKISENNLCSFKLDLTDQEKEARNAVQLPYVRYADNNASSKTAETKIHYNADENDDWDEEDPDNDLEFV